MNARSVYILLILCQILERNFAFHEKQMVVLCFCALLFMCHLLSIYQEMMQNYRFFVHACMKGRILLFLLVYAVYYPIRIGQPEL